MSLTPPFSLPNTEPAGFNVSITKEEFNLFYRVDRLLFTRLVKSLRRDTSQSINVMAFIMWLEKQAKESFLVEKILQCWSDGMLSSLADEAVVVLDFVEVCRIPHDASTKNILPFISHILRGIVTLDFFYDQRLEIIAEITNLINDVCVRAFDDIVEQWNSGMSLDHQSLFHGNVYGAAANVAPRYMNPQVVYFDPNSIVPIPMVAQQVVDVDPNAVPMVVQVVDPYMQQNLVLEQFNGLGGIAATNNELGVGTYYAFNTHQNQIQSDMNQILANLNLDDDNYAVDTGNIAAPARNDNGQRIDMRPNIKDRTLFMTFSKGPISDKEIRDFFNRKFGDIIERLIIQQGTNIPASEQSVYARLVVRGEAIGVIDYFLDYKPKMKFTMNGKHVCARKYVHKHLPPPSAAGKSRFFP